MTRLFCFETRMKISRLVKRLLIALSLTAMFGILIALGAIVTPLQYRIGLWQRLPVLDHRLLPHLSAVFAAAFGAFFGSLSAFYLGRVQQRRFTKLKLYWFPISPTFVPFTDLTFVLETKDPNILHEIHLAEQNYRACVDALQLRNQELQKFYENPRVSHQIRDFETGAGVASASQRDLIFLRQATDALYLSVDRTLPRLTGAIEKLEKLIKSMFPGRQALRMIPDSPPTRANAK